MISVSAHGLCKSYKIGVRRNRRTVPVLRDIDMEIGQGEFVSIIGPSGSGKSTLLYCLSGLTKADSGDIKIAGNNLASLNKEALSRLRRRHVGFIFQSFCLIPSLNIFDNVSIQAQLSGIHPTHQYVEETLKHVGLSGRGSERVAALSGGEQQRVAIARALVADPDIIFADEPTGSLDAKSGSTILGLLSEYCSATSRTLLLVTHDLTAAALSDRAILIKDGRINAEKTHPTAKALFEFMGED